MLWGTKKVSRVTLDHSLYELLESPYDEGSSGSIYNTSTFRFEILS